MNATTPETIVEPRTTMILIKMIVLQVLATKSFLDILYMTIILGKRILQIQVSQTLSMSNGVQPVGYGSLAPRIDPPRLVQGVKATPLRRFSRASLECLMRRQIHQVGHQVPHRFIDQDLPLNHFFQITNSKMPTIITTTTTTTGTGALKVHRKQGITSQLL